MVGLVLVRGVEAGEVDVEDIFSAALLLLLSLALELENWFRRE
jgi:hypothetical protein